MMRHVRDSRVASASQNPAREIVHDLRNLFAVIASIQHLLTKNVSGPDGQRLLRSLEATAARGGQLTSRLLSKKIGRERHLLDIGAQVADAAPMLQAAVAPLVRLEIDTQVAVPAALVSADPADVEAVVLELVANAQAAGARRIAVRCRRVGDWIWLVVADDGPGLLMNGSVPGSAVRQPGHGVGLNRVRRAVRDMDGRLLIRGSAGAGAGTAVAMLLPVASRAVSKSRARERREFPLDKESCDEDRRTVAA